MSFPFSKYVRMCIRTCTVRFKSMNPRYNIRMYWMNFCQPTNRVKQNIFEQTLIKDVSLSLYASFGTFCVQIGQLFESQWAFEECLNIDKSLWSIFPKSFVLYDLWAGKNSFSTYVCYTLDSLIWTELYITFSYFFVLYKLGYRTRAKRPTSWIDPLSCPFHIFMLFLGAVAQEKYLASFIEFGWGFACFFAILKDQNPILKMWKVNRPTAVYSRAYDK